MKSNLSNLDQLSGNDGARNLSAAARLVAPIVSEFREKSKKFKAEGLQVFLSEECSIKLVALNVDQLGAILKQFSPILMQEYSKQSDKSLGEFIAKYIYEGIRQPVTTMGYFCGNATDAQETENVVPDATKNFSSLLRAMYLARYVLLPDIIHNYRLLCDSKNEVTNNAINYFKILQRQLSSILPEIENLSGLSPETLKDIRKSDGAKHVSGHIYRLDKRVFLFGTELLKPRSKIRMRGSAHSPR